MSHESGDRNKTLLRALAAQSTLLHERNNNRTRDRATAMRARAIGTARRVGGDAGEEEGVVPNRKKRSKLKSGGQHARIGWAI